MDRHWVVAAVITALFFRAACADNKPLKAFFAQHNIQHTERFMNGGSCDMVYKAHSHKGPMVVRILRRTRSLKKRQQIILTTDMAGQLGWGPSVIWYDPDHVALVTAYIEGGHPTPGDMKKPVVWAGLARRVAALHKSTPALSVKVLPLKKRALKRWREVKRYVPSSYLSMWHSLQQHIQKLPHRLDRVFIHGDLKRENLFLKEGRPLFIDWGESGYGSSYDDLGVLFYHAEATTKDMMSFMKVYLGRDPTPDELKILQYHKYLACLNHRLWKARLFCKAHRRNKAAIMKHLDFFKRFL